LALSFTLLHTGERCFMKSDKLDVVTAWFKTVILKHPKDKV